MPGECGKIKSKAQQRYLFANMPRKAKKMADKMPKGKLKSNPEYVRHALVIPTDQNELEYQLKMRCIHILTTNSASNCWSMEDRPWLEKKSLPEIAGYLGLSPIENAGTSEGAYKAWQTRSKKELASMTQDEKDERAKARAKTAEWASSVADRMEAQKDPDAEVDHGVAMRAHKSAGKAFMEADWGERADYHFDKAMAHKLKMKELGQMRPPQETDYQKAMRSETERQAALAAGGSGTHRDNLAFMSPEKSGTDVAKAWSFTEKKVHHSWT